MARLMKAPLCGIHAGGAFSIYHSRSVLKKSHRVRALIPLKEGALCDG